MFPHAWRLQNKLKQRVTGFKFYHSDFFMVATIVCIMLGVGIFMYCLLRGINMDLLVLWNDPFTFMITGVFCFFMYRGMRRKEKNSK